MNHTVADADEDRAGPERVKVGIADFAVADGSAELVTSGLGSCIGIGLYCERSDVAGLVHAMLPREEEAAGGDPAKFVDAGVAGLLDAMRQRGANPACVEAKMAGGADMLAFSSGPAVGARNVEAARSVLAAHDVPIVAEEVGGEHGRSLTFQGGELTVRSAEGTLVL